MQERLIKPFIPADADWVITRHAALYASDEGYDASFVALVAQIVADFVAAQPADGANGWIAWHGEQRQGCVFVVQESPTVAKLRLFLVEPDSRGTGLAQRLLETALGFSRDSGYKDMRLWTHESHAAAGRLYARNGFSLVESTKNRAFGCDVVDQIWHRKL